MSQQKMLFAACVAAGLVALVASQSFNPSKCSQNAQTTLTNYQQSVTTSMQTFVNELASKGSSAFDMNGFTQDAQALLQQYTQMADTSNGFDLQNMVGQGAKLMQSQAALMRYFVNPSLGPEFFGMYMNFASKMMSQYTSMVTSVSSQCLPGGR